MSLRDRLGALFGRSAEPAVPATPPVAGSGANGVSPAAGSPFSTLPPWNASNWPAFAWSGAAAENVATLAACIDIIASAIATLPALVFERMADGSRRETATHPVCRLIAAPNDLMTWSDLVRFLMGSVLFFGNGVCVIERDGNGQPSALFPVPWPAIMPLLVPTSAPQSMGPTTPNSRLALDVVWSMCPFPLPGARMASGSWPTRYFPDAGELVFLREKTQNGLLGVSRIARAPLVVQQALAVQQFATFLWDSVGTPNISLSHPGRLGPEAVNNIGESWRQNVAGPLNARKPLILEEGMKAEPLSANAEDSEVLDSRQFAAEEIARLYGVPPPLVGIWRYSSFTNSEQANVWFGQNTLAPWCRAIELEFARSVFVDPSRFELELDLGGLLRGDYATRARVGIDLQRAGTITPNELRHELGYAPIAGGDRLMPQSVGGRPPGVEDGAGNRPSAPGANGRLNGAAGTA
jgi:phage portal protein BeeE